MAETPERGEKTRLLREYIAAHPEVNPAALVEGMKHDHDIDIPESLASNMLYGKNADGSPRRVAPKGRASKKKNGTTEKNGDKVTKSDKIRQFFEKYPGAAPSQVVAALERDGLHVTSSLVSVIKTQLSGRRGTGKKLGPRTGPPRKIAARGGEKTKAEHIREAMAKFPQQSPVWIAARLSNKGIPCTPELVRQVHDRDTRGRYDTKAGRAPRGGRQPNRNGVEKGGVQELIHKFLNRHPNWMNQSAKKIAASIEEHTGTKCSVPYVSFVRSRLRTGGLPAAAATRRQEPPRGHAGRREVMEVGDAITAVQLLEVKRLADELGGIEHLREALGALDELRGSG